MVNWFEASDKIEALLKSVAAMSKYEDRAHQTAYTCGYLSMVMIDLYSKSQTVRDTVDARMADLMKDIS